MERNGVWLDSAELYEPETGRFTPTGKMLSRRAGATATLLPGGKVLIAGGVEALGKDVATAELYDPASNTFTLTGTMSTPRGHAIAVLLKKTGQVLIAGGAASGDSNPQTSAELYDPATGRFTPTGSMSSPRAYFNAVTLNDGRVLVMGGVSGGDFPTPNLEATAEVYDPMTGRFSQVGSMNVSRYKHAAALLHDGRAIVIGGQGQPGARLASTEIFDPTSGKFSRGPEMRLPRYKLPQGVVELRNGRVLVAGGADQMEVYDPSANAFTTLAGPKLRGYLFSTATVLSDGKVLLVNGYGNRPTEGAVRQAWVWEP
jgi:N-acetylneuraminic acid mutarotase